MHRDEIYMKRCLELAAMGLGKTYPNPMVGSVIVHRDVIIGEGWHEKAGCPHAEVHAISSVKNKLLLEESTLYVNLEPCAHYGKTPPCAALIIKHKIPNVVVGCVDPFSEVSGKGIELMRSAGICVKVGVMEQECEDSHKRFFTFHKKQRPYIILKWAETKDGFIAPINQMPGKPLWITNTESKKRVHKWRTEEASILAGTTTIEMDNPELTARLCEGNQPLRLILDRSLRLSTELNVFDDSTKTLVFTTKFRKDTDVTQYIKINFDFLHQEIVKKLFERNIQSILIEGGRETLQSFIDIDLWDEARVFIGCEKICKGITAPLLNSSKKSVDSVSTDQLIVHYNV
jgi:diaminohydroxyphosphoribosylaminopyrimidine deaminase/5-amino-6-(5-phosphoribosylamino)uracil reductase